MERVVNLALIQMSCGEDAADNLSKATDNIREAAGRGAEIICTQELFKTRYFCQIMDGSLFSLAERLDKESPPIQSLCELAAELEIVLIASLFEKRALGLYHNTAVVIDADGRTLGKYRKMHIPDDPRYYEKFYFTPGDLGYKVFRTRYADIGVLICWDQWFPEAARLTAMMGAEIILIPTAIGSGLPRKSPGGRADLHDSWQIVQRGHAVANACYLAAVNRVGFEPDPLAELRTSLDGESGIDFWGGSFVAALDGRVVGQASREDEELLLCPVDLGLIEKVRTGESFPFRDRRVDSYGDLNKLYLNFSK